jgi:hypothetical protein
MNEGAQSMGLLDGYFDAFKDLFPAISKASFHEDYKNFAVEEFKRFYSIGGTILGSILPNQAPVGERLFSHILLRSIFENFFWLIYIFDGPDVTVWRDRFNQYMNGFKNEYYKLCNEAALPKKDQLVAADPAWKDLRAPDLRSLLAQVKTIRGERLDYLYFVYRVTSFDTHGKTLKSLFTAAFNKDCNFPVMKVSEAINLIADSYIAIWNQINR